ncbi:NmrA family NAD(P)-binding protein [Flavihumibacter sp. ZG627]|uniref:NmrA family NAD(P)-binding protein n=1 Tax=Flavihumibacter sp. ZG627 TaxID=1463156 RepID=UPI0006932A58|nr:NmrA family NAD(P)-binding protein [Flavihumibacter sp. ZG627]
MAGATGQLGQRIAHHLLNSNHRVIALVRKETNSTSASQLEKQGVVLCEVDFNDPSQLVRACTGAHCIVSALNGLEDVMIDLQMNLLHAAIDAGVPRFIPSDYCINYTKLPDGSNRNLDLRRKFNEQLDKTPIEATSILNGMFTDLLTGEAPLILFGLKRVIYWGDANQNLDFTTLENTAEYTGRAAVDEATPRYLRIAGDVVNAEGLKDAVTAATGNGFKLLRVGGLGGLKTMINITRTIIPKKEEVFPPWQGMQYLHNMLSGKPKFSALDNDRYQGIRWTTVQEVLAKR